ncbi:TRAP transporter substrate-binding protein [Bradyrhizobium sp. 6(2017)]|uniref:TRAP transporter substrate-binding protein n=1 Tax=Bradyrhizobium sp. 6(2017) TaxID=1197460 RepID=UPI0013E124DA|nr:TRAP transporter substrate-binding protein [Bradyrhizobium sp. 6(2017)]QIG94182.1 TRAP transporter substrate-binding protein [Bradyrhizobium sp. 6(2017)]
MTITRRTFLKTHATAVGAAYVALPPSLALAAPINFKIGHDQAATHPVHLRLVEAGERIKLQTNGQFLLQVFANSQLGGDTDMLTQTRSGALEMVLMPDIILGTLVPLASINAMGFAFDNEVDVHAAMDGDLGAHIRGRIAGSGLSVMRNFWENGFRQITSSTKPINHPEDLRGFKIRVPVAPLWVSMFKAFGCGPTAMNMNELYSALQTKVVEGQENPFSIIESAKFYEVQKYCSVTNHVWNGFWLSMNSRRWSAVPATVQDIVQEHLNRSAMDLRDDVVKQKDALRKSLVERGMVLNETDPKPFRDALQAAGFYAEWHKKFGEESWAVLTKYAKAIA